MSCSQWVLVLCLPYIAVPIRERLLHLTALSSAANQRIADLIDPIKVFVKLPFISLGEMITEKVPLGCAAFLHAMLHLSTGQSSRVSASRIIENFELILCV